MSSNLMSTEPGGEQTQYESAATEISPHSKSTGQLGAGTTSTNANTNTTVDPTNTKDASQQQAQRGEKTAENIPYGRTNSEGGMGGRTTEATGEGDKRSGESDGVRERVVEGYGGGRDMNREVGA